MKLVFDLYREVLEVLPLHARRFLMRASVLLASLAVFDAAALGLLAVAIAPISIGQRVSLPFVGTLDDIGVVILILIICLVMIAKGVLSVVVIWWMTRRVVRYEVELGDRLLQAYLRAPWVERLKRNSSDMVRLADSGIDVTINSFLLPGVTLLSEFVSLVVIVLTLAAVQPVIALITLAYVALLGLVIFAWIAPRTRKAGTLIIEIALKVQRLVLEMVGTLKELSLRGKEDEVAALVRANRQQGALGRANMFFLGQVPRFILEAGLIGGFVIVGAAGMLIGGIEQAIAAVALFGLAGFRLAPAVIRAQSVFSQMISVASYPRFVIDEVHSSERSVAVSTRGTSSASLPPSPQALSFEDVTFSYLPGSRPAVEGVSLTIPFGSTVAVVGQSGSGKSTLVDLILSLLEPDSGSITVDGVPLRELRDEWRARVGYVPQQVALFDASIAQNVALTWQPDFDSDRVKRALEQAQLWEFVAARDGGIDSLVGEGGMALSGGQRQRLGIARALYADPLVLVLDEATSALDTSTEAAVSDAITKLSGERTLVVVAHRLATIKGADRVFLMREGHVVGAGRFEELVAQFPDFAAQAELAGLA